MSAAFPKSSVNVPLLDMTLRDYFAGQALAGICAPLYDDESPTIWKHREFAKGAYMFADAMLAARKEGNK